MFFRFLNSKFNVFLKFNNQIYKELDCLQVAFHVHVVDNLQIVSLNNQGLCTLYSETNNSKLKVKIGHRAQYLTA